MFTLPPSGNEVYKYIDSRRQNASALFGSEFRRLLDESVGDEREIIILCIGTDRATGDSLGPITGSKLLGRTHGTVGLFGTLDEPVHAKNLPNVIDAISSSHKKPFIVAVDAALGSEKRVGFLRLGKGPVYPGAGMRKSLQPVGNLHITGVVNAAGGMEPLVLQTTKLSLVMHMADVISDGIKKGLYLGS